MNFMDVICYMRGRMGVCDGSPAHKLTLYHSLTHSFSLSLHRSRLGGLIGFWKGNIVLRYAYGFMNTTLILSMSGGNGV